MEFDITLVIMFVIGLIFGLVSQGSQVVQAFVRKMKGRVPSEWHWMIDDVAAVAVRAAEQIWRSKQYEVFDRLEYAKDRVRAEAARLNISYDEEMLTALIEAKVFELLNADKEEPAG
jgi:hypothetical protein